MEFWPAEYRHEHPKTTKERVKNQSKRYEYPSVESGRLGAVSLVERDGRFEWARAFQDNPRALKCNEPMTIFPTTRPPPTIIPQTSIQHRAEQSANFLRTVLPEVDITSELVRDELVSDERITRSLEQYNPLAGNVLEILPGAGKASQYVVFPIGELGCELNVSPILSTDQGEMFRPEAQSTRSFPTPIRQLISNKSVSEDQSSLLGVRTHGPTVILAMQPDEEPGGPKITELASFSRMHMGDRLAMDMAFLAQSLDSVLVNDRGSIYKCNIGIASLDAISHEATTFADSTWRLASSSLPHGLLFSSGKTVQEFDMRDPATPSSLFQLSDTIKDLIAGIESPLNEHIIPLCSTSEIFWLDRRAPGKPLLGYRHRRAYDRTLTTLSFNNFTLLTSRKNELVTVHDLSLPDKTLQLWSHPYALPFGQDTFTGHALIKRADEQVSMYRVSERGRIVRYDMSWSDHITAQGLEWSDGVRSLNKMELSLKPDVGPLGKRDYSTVDLRPAYNYMFVTLESLREEEERGHADAVYDLVDNLPTFWHRAEAPVDQMLTTYDILLSSGDAPEYIPRSDFLSGSIFNSTRGYRALAQSRFPWNSLREGAAWHRDIGPNLATSPSVHSDNIGELSDKLQVFDLNMDEDHLIQAERRQKEAREQLSLDLMLSKDVFCHRPVTMTPASSADLALETMTEALTLGAEPPPVDFSFLHPVRKADYYSRDEDNDSEIAPLGVRLLLKEWELGANPEQMVYKDPYEDDTLQKEPDTGPRFVHYSPPSPQEAYIPPSQVPPSLIVTSNSMVPTIQVTSKQHSSQQSPAFESQPSQGQRDESQGFIASTQVLPGPFGGRPKKKPAKKRMGGF
uniref:Uncharacterized protein n=1 Tax=Moniliophthora roreri TaxID=221103 RepID=A0A0W0FLK0_MONRR